jgi:hypothetical protein
MRARRRLDSARTRRYADRRGRASALRAAAGRAVCLALFVAFRLELDNPFLGPAPPRRSCASRNLGFATQRRFPDDRHGDPRHVHRGAYVVDSADRFAFLALLAPSGGVCVCAVFASAARAVDWGVACVARATSARKPTFSHRNHNSIAHYTRAMDRDVLNRQIASHEDCGRRCAYIGGTPARRDSVISLSSIVERAKGSADDNECDCAGWIRPPQAMSTSEGVSPMARTSALLGAVRFVLCRADSGHVVALRVVAAAASAMSAIGKHCSIQRIRVFFGPQTASLAVAIEVEILSNSWRGRHQPPEQET